MDSQDEDENEEDGNEEIDEIEKWSEYVEKYAADSDTINSHIKEILIKRPVFLTRNAHCLKKKHQAAHLAKESKKTEAPLLKEEASPTEPTQNKLDSIREETNENDDSNKLEALSIQDNGVYKFQVNSYKLLHSANTTSVMYRRNAFKNAKKVF
jgi:hypothetical protein